MKARADFIKLINHIKPLGANTSVYIINLKTDETFEYNPDTFIYPASTYKIFIAAETLRQIEQGKLSTSDTIIIKSPNDIDPEAKFYPTDIFPILKEGDKVDVDTLLKLMLRRSDNTASNTLIDLVGRENISKNIINSNGWNGSDVTRKFLNRAHENKKYRHADITLSCGRHLAEFMQKVYNNTLVDQFVSQNMKKYLSDGSDRTENLPHRNKRNWLGQTLYEKGGWIQASSKKSLHIIKHRYQSQAAIVQTVRGDIFAIGILAHYKTIRPWRYFRFSKITNWLSR